jgi:hypothetical protein
LIAASLATIFLLSLSPVAAQFDDSVFSIVTTTRQTTDLTTILAGDLLSNGAEITGLMGAGVDPHLHQRGELTFR